MNSSICFTWGSLSPLARLVKEHRWGFSPVVAPNGMLIRALEGFRNSDRDIAAQERLVETSQ